MMDQLEPRKASDNVRMVNVRNQDEALEALMERHPTMASDLMSRSDLWMIVKLGTVVQTGATKLVVVANSGGDRELDKLAKAWGVNYDWRDFGGVTPVLRVYWKAEG